MNQPSERIECANCHAANPPNAELCRQCGQPLHREETMAVHEPSPGEGEISEPSQRAEESTSDSGTGTEEIGICAGGSALGRNTRHTYMYIILGWTLVALGFFCCCYILPIVGIALGLLAYSKDDDRGLLVAIAGLIVLVLTSIALILIIRHTYCAQSWPSARI